MKFLEKAPFSFSGVDFFLFLSFLLLLGILLRLYIPFFRYFLFPASVIGGLIGFLLHSLGFFSFPKEIREAFAFHLFNLSFIAIGLIHEEKRGKAFLKGALWMAAIQGVIFSGQALIGMGVFSFFSSSYQGLLLPLGFNEGPGQAISFGKIWEKYGIPHSVDVGASFAAIGYLVGFLLGTPILSFLLKKKVSLDSSFQKGILPSSQKSSVKEIFYSSNIETFAYYFALIGGVYILTLGFIFLLSLVVPPSLVNMLWGFTFLWGLVVALFVKKGFLILHKENFLDKDSFRKIGNVFIEYMVVAVFVSIDIALLKEKIGAILIASILGAFFTLGAIFYFSRIFSSHRIERIAAILGTTTGTVSTGLILLKIADPKFQSQVAEELAFMNVFAIPIVGSLSFLIQTPFITGISVYTLAAILFLGVIFFGSLTYLMKKLPEE